MSQVITPSSTHNYPFAFAGKQPTMDAKERFFRQFQGETTNLQNQIERLGSLARIGGERLDATEHILAGISQLSTEVADASSFLPAYDQRIYAQAIKALTDKLNAETERLAPRSRFKFKPRTAASEPAPRKNDPRNMRLSPLETDEHVALHDEPDTVGSLPSFSKNYNAEMEQSGSAGIRKPSFSSAKDVSISDHNGLHIILPSTASRATTSGSLTNLKDCIVDMSIPTAGSAAFRGLTLKNISKSLIIAGHVDGPAHITGLKDCVVVVSARQVRIHECKNVDMYLHCTSRPIIEDCSGMRFAPSPNCYMSDHDKSETNQWDRIDDFKWLKSEPSPNWTIIEEQDRLGDDIWTKTVPGGPGVGVNDILRKVGV